MSTTPRPLHIGKFVPPPFAGIEAHIDTLLRALVPAAQPTLLASRPPGRDSVLSPTPYRTLAVACHGTLASVPISPRILGVAREELRIGGANLLHTHAPNPWGDLAAITAGRDVPVVMSWHSDIVRQRLLLRAYGPLQRRAVQRADRIIVFTPLHRGSSTQLDLPGVDAKLVMIPMGIDFAALDARPLDAAVAHDLARWAADRTVALAVGRHVYYKGFGYLLSALAATRESCVLALVGTGPLTPALRAQATALGLADRVRFYGQVTDSVLATLLSSCDFFCLPSVEPSEAFGIASAEAMAFGRPTIVCELGNGVNYLNRSGVTSLVCPPRDVGALADALDRLSRDAPLRRRMGEAARAWVRSEFDVGRMRDATLALYRSVL